MHRIVCFALAVAPLWVGCASVVRPTTGAATGVASPLAPEAAFAPLEPFLGKSAAVPEAPTADPGMSDMPGMDMPGMARSKPGAKGKEAKMTKPEPAAVYTCPMHPKIHEPKPGKCPICGMTLKPVKTPPDGGHR